MSQPTSTNRTAAAALIYWLLVMCGLAGLSVLRVNEPREYVPLWIGSVAGVALGQLLSWLRLRLWLIAVMTIVLLGVSPVLFAVIYAVFGGFNVGIDTCLLAFVPAAVCGYLSLSERAGLVAFWYPAMLWMLVILDRPAAGAFDARRALPLVIGLGALFVAFLRSRETRRTAIWSTHATVRLAEPLSRVVLRSSPLRSASQHAWTGLVGAAALLLAAWVAPHLWKKESATRPNVPMAQPSAETLAAVTVEPGAEPCCSGDELEDQRRERVREYFPLTHGSDVEAQRAARPPCAVCQSGKRRRLASCGAKGVYASDRTTKGYGAAGYATGGYAAGYTADSTTLEGYGSGGYGSGGYGNGGYGNGGYGNGGYAPELPLPEPTPEVTPLPPAPALAPSPRLAAPPRLDVAPSAPPPRAPSTDTEAARSPSAPAQVSPKPAVVFIAPQPAAPPANAGAPWRAAFALCLAGIGLHVALRAVRRQLTLRHLARPFWRETLDQRVSNHWQRMLIGLRDAGIHSRADEQPQALAKRVGIDGMSTCATILERVRHGIRVDAADLDAMDAAAAAVYRAARAKAGLAGRAAGLVRSPL